MVLVLMISLIHQSHLWYSTKTIFSQVLSTCQIGFMWQGRGKGMESVISELLCESWGELVTKGQNKASVTAVVTSMAQSEEWPGSKEAECDHTPTAWCDETTQPFYFFLGAHNCVMLNKDAKHVFLFSLFSVSPQQRRDSPSLFQRNNSPFSNNF